MDIRKCIIGYSYDWVPINESKNNEKPNKIIKSEVVKLKDIDEAERKLILS